MSNRKIFLLALCFLVSILYKNWELLWPAPAPFSMDPEYKNICLNYKEMSNSTNAEKLREFIKSPCDPIIFVPGYLASRLIAEIDCEELQTHHPEIFADCHWNSCTTDFWPFYRKPSAHYNLWLPDFTGPLGMLTPNYFTEQCFLHMVEVKLDQTHKPPNIEDLILKKRGINVTWFGNTPSTLKPSNCSQETLKDL
jgi:hypothetical protein